MAASPPRFFALAKCGRPPVPDDVAASAAIVEHDEGANSALPTSGYFITALRLPEGDSPANRFCSIEGGRPTRLYPDAATRLIGLGAPHCAVMAKTGNMTKRIIQQGTRLVFTADW